MRERNKRKNKRMYICCNSYVQTYVDESDSIGCDRKEDRRYLKRVR